MDQKTCARCGETKTFDLFPRTGRRCKKCESNRVIERRKRIEAEAKSRRCSRCGETKPYAEMASPSACKVCERARVRAKAGVPEDQLYLPKRSEMTLMERFESAVIVLPNGCWEWQLSCNGNGYAQFSLSATSTATAATWIFEQFFGPIPSGMTKDHLCHTNDLACPGGKTCPHRRCVNPAHLEVVTRGENARRSRKIQAQLAITHCPQGHEYTPENTWIYNRMRSCKKCAQERALTRLA